MKNKKEWETKSLQWIHRVREEIDEEIKRKGMTPAQWVKARGKIDIEELCKKMGLKNITVVEPRLSHPSRKVQTR
jgi:hypothetical protein